MTIRSFCLLSLSLSACSDQSLPEECGAEIRDCGGFKSGLYDYDGDGYCEDVDCNEGACDINPGSREVCDGIDNDCDGFIDTMDKNVDYDTRGEDADAAEFYRDYDCDGQYQDDETKDMCIASVDGPEMWPSRDVQYVDHKGDAYCVSDRTVDDIQEAIESMPEGEERDEERNATFDCCDRPSDPACDDSRAPECQYTTEDGECAMLEVGTCP